MQRQLVRKLPEGYALELFRSLSAKYTADRNPHTFGFDFQVHLRRSLFLSTLTFPRILPPFRLTTGSLTLTSVTGIILVMLIVLLLIIVLAI